MTPFLLLLVALAGGVGAVLRLVVDAAVTARSRTTLPLGTAAVNVSGSFAIGIVAPLSATVMPVDVATVLATGLLGGYTTFSAASVDTVRLLRDGRRGAAAAYAAGLVVVSTAAAALGAAVSLGLLALADHPL